MDQHHINMFGYFGGCTRLLIPDNLKTGILSNKKYEDPVSNRSYQELADHYHTAILPTRVLAPKDYLQNYIIINLQKVSEYI